MLLHYLKLAVRQLLKYKTQNVISIVGLSVALLCFTLCLFVTRYALDVDECFQNKDRIVQFYYNEPPRTTLFYDTDVEVEKVNPTGLKCLTRVGGTDYNDFYVETAPGKMEPCGLIGWETDSNYVTVFTPEILAGSWAQAANTPNSMVITESAAKRLFGSVNAAVGRKFNLKQKSWFMTAEDWPENGVFYTVQAVINDIPTNTTIAFSSHIDYLVLNDECSMGNSPKQWRYSSTWGMLYGLLDETTDLEDFCADFDKRDCKIHRNSDDSWSVHCDEMGKHSYFDQNIRAYMTWIPFVAGTLALLVGCLNFFHFLIGSQLTRLREYSIGRVNGATGWNLIVQLTVQSGLMILISGVLAFVMAELLSPHLQFDAYFMSIDFACTELYLQLASYLFGLFLVALLINVVVVWHVRRIPVQDGIFGGSRKYGRKRLRNVMLCIQLIIAWVFVCVTVVYYQQGQKVEEELISFISPEDKERIIALDINDKFTDEAEKQAIIDKIKALPDVEETLIGSTNLLQVASTMLATTAEFTQDSELRVNFFRMPENGVSFTGMKILKGAGYQKPGDILVDEKLAGILAEKTDGDVIGMKLYYYGGVEYTVVGIVEEIVLRTERPMDGYYIEMRREQVGYDLNYFKCMPGTEDKVCKAIDEILAKYYPDTFKPEYSSIMDELRVRESEIFFIRDVAMFMSVVILLICLLGVYSAITLDTEFRQKEMAIRKVNGAGMKDIAMLFARLYIVLLTVSFALALPVVLKVVDYVSSLYYIFIDTGITFYVLIFLAMTLIVTLTVAWKIWRISKVNPADVVRKE